MHASDGRKRTLSSLTGVGALGWLCLSVIVGCEDSAEPISQQAIAPATDNIASFPTARQGFASRSTRNQTFEPEDFIPIDDMRHIDRSLAGKPAEVEILATARATNGHEYILIGRYSYYHSSNSVWYRLYRIGKDGERLLLADFLSMTTITQLTVGMVGPDVTVTMTGGGRPVRTQIDYAKR